MKKLDFGQSVNTLANLGVIAGIIFLAFELQQNNANLEAQSRYNHASQVAGYFHGFASNSELSGLLVKARHGDRLDPVEAFQLEQLYLETFIVWQWEFEEERLGRIPAPTDSYIRILGECTDRGAVLYPGIRSVWDTNRTVLKNEEFVSFIERNLAAGACQ